MSKSINSRSAKADLQAYAHTELGFALPDEMTREDMYAAIKAELAQSGDAQDDDPASDAQGDLQSDSAALGQAAAAEKERSALAQQPTHFTIRVAKPVGCTVPDMVVTANGTNTQIQFAKDVKISAAAYFALCDAVEIVPAHRDLDSKEWIPAREEPRFSFVTIKEHF